MHRNVHILLVVLQLHFCFTDDVMPLPKQTSMILLKRKPVVVYNFSNLFLIEISIHLIIKMDRNCVAVVTMTDL